MSGMSRHDTSVMTPVSRLTFLSYDTYVTYDIHARVLLSYDIHAMTRMSRMTLVS